MRSGITPLHHAAFVGDKEQALDLLNNRRNDFLDMLITATETDLLPLDCAVPRGHLEIVKVLVRGHRYSDNKYVICNKQGFHPIIQAAHWWCNFVQGSAFPDKHYSHYTKKPERDFPAIMLLLIDYYDRICSGIELGLCDTVHEMNALLPLIRIMTLKESCAGDIKMHKEQAKIVAKKLMEKGVSLDCMCKSGLTPRRLAKQHGILTKVESMEHAARLTREQKTNTPSVIEVEQPKKIGPSKSKQKPSNAPLITILNEKKQSLEPQTTSLPTMTEAPSIQPSNMLSSVSNKDPEEQKTSHPTSLQSVPAKTQSITPDKLVSLTSADKKPTSKEKKPSTLFSIKYKLGPEKPFTDEEVKKIIRDRFSANINDKNLDEEAKKIVAQLKTYPITQNMRSRISDMIVSNLQIEGYTYKGFFCRTKVPIIAFNEGSARNAFDYYFKVPKQANNKTL